MSKRGMPEGYVEVKDRIVAFLEKYPEGSLQPANPDKPYEVVELGDKTWLIYVAAAFRHPEDQKPGIGIAWEQYPGTTPYTKGSELMNLETSAWGRALAALGFEVHRSVASAEEVSFAKARTVADMSDKELEVATGGKILITADQRSRFKKACQALSWTEDDLNAWLKDELGAEADLEHLGKGDGDAALRLLRDKVRELRTAEKAAA